VGYTFGATLFLRGNVAWSRQESTGEVMNLWGQIRYLIQEKRDLCP